MCTIGDFPSAGQNVTVEWDQHQQSFLVTEIHSEIQPEFLSALGASQPFPCEKLKREVI